MNHRLKIILLLNLLVPVISVKAQLFNKPIVLEGKIIDESTSQHISFVQLLNESKRKWAICDDNGSFRIPVDMGDTLAFSALGYLGKVVIVDDSIIQNGLTVALSPRFYEIDKIKVFGFRNYSDFKVKFKALKLPETKTDILRENLAEISKRIAGDAAYNKEVSDKQNQSGVGVSIPMSFLSRSKEDKQRMHLQEILKQEDKQHIIEKKYNREIIADLTHLKDDELTNFMIFCNFNEEYLLKTDQYDILVEVLKKLKLYKSLNKSGFIFENNLYGFYPET